MRAAVWYSVDLPSGADVPKNQRSGEEGKPRLNLLCVCILRFFTPLTYSLLTPWYRTIILAQLQCYLLFRIACGSVGTYIGPCTGNITKLFCSMSVWGLGQACLIPYIAPLRGTTT